MKLFEAPPFERQNGVGGGDIDGGYFLIQREAFREPCHSLRVLIMACCELGRVMPRLIS